MHVLTNYAIFKAPMIQVLTGSVKQSLRYVGTGAFVFKKRDVGLLFYFHFLHSLDDSRGLYWLSLTFTGRILKEEEFLVYLTRRLAYPDSLA
jgi:hypothetical protein